MKRGGKAASGNGRTRSPSGTSGKAGGPKAPAKPRKTAAKSKSKAPAAKRDSHRQGRAGRPRQRRGGGRDDAQARRDHRPRPEAPRRAARTSALTPTETRLLDDLFAIVEEHAADSAVADRPRRGRPRLRLRLRAPRRPAAQVGRGLHHPPGGGGQDLRGHAPRHRDAVRRAAARHGRGHERLARRGARAVRRRGGEPGRRRDQADRASPSSRATRRRPRTTAR